MSKAKAAVASSQNDETDSPIFFFKEEEVPYGIFCQWYASAFVDPASGIRFTCAEQWMMWRKARMAGDEASATQILATTSPRQHKQLGRQVQNFDADEWNRVKLGVVEEGNYLKFQQCTVHKDAGDEGETTEAVPLKDVLLGTGDRMLVEASPFDRIWGIGYGADQAVTTARSKWGQNLLGKALMNVRERIRAEMTTAVEKAEK